MKTYKLGEKAIALDTIMVQQQDMRKINIRPYLQQAKILIKFCDFDYSNFLQYSEKDFPVQNIGQNILKDIISS